MSPNCPVPRRALLVLQYLGRRSSDTETTKDTKQLLSPYELRFTFCASRITFPKPATSNFQPATITVVIRVVTGESALLNLSHGS
jgi:hypothetical protein